MPISNSADLDLYTDASWVGFGGYCKRAWFQGRRDQSSALFCEGELSIAYKEWYPIVITSVLW